MTNRDALVERIAREARCTRESARTAVEIMADVLAGALASVVPELVLRERVAFAAGVREGART